MSPFDFFTIVASDVLIQQDHVQVAVGKDAVEVLKFAYSKITWTYQAEDVNGVINATDVSAVKLKSGTGLP